MHSRGVEPTLTGKHGVERNWSVHVEMGPYDNI